jgi:anti-sigma B factor antagonist
MSAYDVQVEQRASGTVVHLSGLLDVAAAPTLRAALIAAVRGDAVANLVVDLSWASFIDSTVIGVLVGAQRRQQSAGNDFTVVLGAEPVRRALQLTGLLEAWKTADSVEAALPDG